MSPEFGATSTLFPIDDETLAYLRLTGRSEAQVDLVERYARAQGLWREPVPRPAFDDLLELDLAGVDPAVAGPRRPQDRVPLPDLPANFRASFPAATPSPGGRPDGGRGRAGRWDRWCGDRGARRRAGRDPERLGGHRGDHLVHEHVEPDGDGRGRPARPQRRRPRAARLAAGQDVARAGLEGRDRLSRGGRPDGAPGHPRLRPGRLRLHHLHRQLRAARRADRGGDRGPRPGGGRRPVGQPQLRGPDPPAGPGQLPRLAAAGRGLRPGRPGGHRPDQRAARRRLRRAAGLPGRDLAAARGDPDGDRPVDLARALPRRPTPASSPATSAGGRCRSRPATASPGIRPRPTSPGRPSSTASASSRDRWPTWSARACWPSWATRSPPTTSRRRARSRRRRRPAAGSRRTASGRSTSTRTVPGAASTR